MEMTWAGEDSRLKPFLRYHHIKKLGLFCCKHHGVQSHGWRMCSDTAQTLQAHWLLVLIMAPALLVSTFLKPSWLRPHTQHAHAAQASLLLLLWCRQYAGTGALKSGFTRTGKRTLGGLIDDGVKSMTRYYLNNFKVSIQVDKFWTPFVLFVRRSAVGPIGACIIIM
jgi:hypothetical protein